MKIFIVASDPGSANAIMPVIATCYKQGHLINGVVSGSATTILSKWPEIEEIDDTTPIDEILNMWKYNRPQIILAGAGAYNLLEHTVRRAAADAGIPCIAVLDYWANYHQRFRRLQGRQWSYSLPDRICVLDEIVLDEMVAEGFAHESLVVTGQPYFECIANWKNNLNTDDLARFRTRFMNDKESILIGFCSEPIFEDMDVTPNNNNNNNLGYTQYTIIKKIACILERLTTLKMCHIHLIIRPHPRENMEKLNDILRNIKKTSLFSYEISKIGTSLEFVLSCDLIIGMTSMVLIEAYNLSRPAISVQFNLRTDDVFYGTTRGYFPSVYNVKELDRKLEQWFNNPEPTLKKPIPHTYGATERILRVIKEIV